jgi:hypothetical protein
MTVNRQIQLLSELYQAYTDNSLKNLELDTKTGTLKEQGFITKIFVNLQYAFSNQANRKALEEKKIVYILNNNQTFLPSSKDPTSLMTDQAKIFINQWKNRLEGIIKEQEIQAIKKKSAKFEGISELDIDNILKKINSLPKNGRVTNWKKLKLNEAEKKQIQLIHKLMPRNKQLSSMTASSKSSGDNALYEKCKKIRFQFYRFEKINIPIAQALHIKYSSEFSGVNKTTDNEGATIFEVSIEHMQKAYALIEKSIPYPLDPLQHSKILACILNGPTGIEDIKTPFCFKIKEFENTPDHQQLNRSAQETFKEERYKDFTYDQASTSIALLSIIPASFSHNSDIITAEVIDENLQSAMQTFYKDTDRAAFITKDFEKQNIPLNNPEIFDKFIKGIIASFNDKKNQDPDFIKKINNKNKYKDINVIPDIDSLRLNEIIEALPEKTKKAFESIIGHIKNLDLGLEERSAVWAHIMNTLLLSNQTVHGLAMAQLQTKNLAASIGMDTAFAFGNLSQDAISPYKQTVFYDLRDSEKVDVTVIAAITSSEEGPLQTAEIALAFRPLSINLYDPSNQTFLSFTSLSDIRFSAVGTPKLDAFSKFYNRK